MFESPPFKACLVCRCPDTFGILDVRGNTLIRRCRVCRSTGSEDLPQLDKKVIYLDQFAISNIYKVNHGLIKESSNEYSRWRLIQHKIHEVYLLQQAIFPESSVHQHETAVSKTPADLELYHGVLSGETCFLNEEDVYFDQEFAFATAFALNQPLPSLDFSIDRILQGERNAWLPKFHIAAAMDHRLLAEKIRVERDKSGAELDTLAMRWSETKPGFEAALRHEMASGFSANLSALDSAIAREQLAKTSDDIYAQISSANTQIYRLMNLLVSIFKTHGATEEEAVQMMARYWQWDGYAHLPKHKITAYLFAIIADRRTQGQKRPPGRGALNDIRAISTYLPYVDAMFIDREFAGFLSDPRVARGIGAKAKVFSLQTLQQFIDYLDALCKATPPCVRKYASEIYLLEK